MYVSLAEDERFPSVMNIGIFAGTPSSRHTCMMWFTSSGSSYKLPTESCTGRTDNARKKKTPDRSSRWCCFQIIHEARGPGYVAVRIRPNLDILIHALKRRPAQLQRRIHAMQRRRPLHVKRAHNLPAACIAHPPLRPSPRTKSDSRVSADKPSPPRHCPACRTAAPPESSPAARASLRW